MAVYGYARVSTAGQAESGESLGTQQRTLEGYAMMHGLKLYKVFVERGCLARSVAGPPRGQAATGCATPCNVVL
jgi:DNA invertase Pin-like site-specific DNA recombinase